MLFVDNRGITDPRRNLALEEFLLRHVDEAEPILLFYINEPAVIIGRNQNTIEEIDLDYVQEKGIHVVRRLSGGGAVYHDLGNLNFSFTTPGRENLHNFAKFTDPVITVLHDLGVDAELRGKSDIFAGDKKISGNAQYVANDRMFSHGTLLFDTDIEEMLRALNPRQVEIESRAVQSVRNFVTNIRDLLDAPMTIEDLQQRLLAGIFGGTGVSQYDLSPADWKRVDKIAAQRYRVWDWNYGRSPEFNVRRREETAVGAIDARINVIEGRVQGLKFYGNFSSKKDVAELASYLKGVRYERDALAGALADIDLTPYLGGLSRADFLNLLY